MTRATLLHVLDQPTALGPAEVRELEQLAQAFPYCQTAHLLLAKAAHDQGTMLAGQRLRRAATYATDRTLLRRLIEQVEPAAGSTDAAPNIAATAQIAPEAVATEVPPAPATSITRETEPENAGTVIAAAPEPQTVEADTPLAAVLNAPVPAAMPAPAPPELAAVSAFGNDVAIDVAATTAQLESAPEATEQLPETAPAETVPALPLKVEPLMLVDQPDILPPVADAVAPEILPGILVAAAPEAEADLPAQAPAIRPPVEVGEARFEFGLAETPAPVAPTYELPGLVDEWAASAVTRGLGSPNVTPDTAAIPVVASAPAASVFTPAAFTGDDTVGYGLGESSRLGFSLQLLNLLTDRAVTAAAYTTESAAAQPPAAQLPPTAVFFEPDALLLNHWAAHSPPVRVLPSSVDLINSFLRRQPRLTRPAMLPPSPTSQTDLSVRSTRTEPDLASESLARILVRQGKTARAIEIYEKLMVKQPEKMAYFTAQIKQLQPPA